ncbi:hypothetical protein ABFS83_14G030800 [Erythranthe nasuta]
MSQNMGWGVIEQGWRKGPWTAEEDKLLIQYVNLHGEGRWNNVARLAGLKRNGKSCRLRWVNYLRPDLKRGQITPHEEMIILELHAKWGNRWSTIARSLPGRTDNEIKNYWRTHFKKKITQSSPDNSEKTRAKLLRRQQFQQQRDHQITDAAKKIVSFNTDGNENRSATSFGQLRQENAYPSVFDHDQELLYSMINEYTSCVSNDQVSNNQDTIIWDNGFWNLDDEEYLLHGNFTGNANINNYQHNLATAFY